MPDAATGFDGTVAPAGAAPPTAATDAMDTGACMHFSWLFMNLSIVTYVYFVPVCV